MTSPLDILAAAIGTPDLRGARCKGSDLWRLPKPEDPDYDDVRDRAAHRCLAECPALALCRQSLARMPEADRPRGFVMAGEVITAPARKPSRPPVPPRPPTRQRALAALAAWEEHRQRTQQSRGTADAGQR